MNKAVVVNIKTDSYDIWCARGSLFGNPYEIGIDGTREQVIERYRKWFNFLLKSKFFREQLYTMKGKRLGCFCVPDKACHVQIIADYVNKL